jgi:hypothetical protein
MPYKYFRDAMTREFEKSKQPEMADPDVFYRELMWRVPGDDAFLLNQKNRRLFKKNGKLRPPYYSADPLFNLYEGNDAFVFCPGPSMGDCNLDVFKGKLTVAANSAAFKQRPMFWAIFESNYMHWLVEQKIPPGMVYIMTARCAIRWRDMFKMTKRSKAIFVPRFEEMKTMPHRTPAVGAMGAIVSAWWMGAKRIFVIGQDLSRPEKKPYVSGVPHSKFGATNSFDEQIIAMKQVTLPGVEIFNASPYSKDKLPFDPIEITEVEKIAADAQIIAYPNV